MAATKKSKDGKLNQTKQQDDETTITKEDTKSNSAKKESTKKKNENGSENDDQGIDVKIPLSLLMTGTSSGSNECSVLVQVAPEDAPTLDFHGAGGAVGRFELNQDTGTYLSWVFIFFIYYLFGSIYNASMDSCHGSQGISISRSYTTRTDVFCYFNASNDWRKCDED